MSLNLIEAQTPDLSLVHMRGNKSALVKLREQGFKLGMVYEHQAIQMFGP